MWHSEQTPQPMCFPGSSAVLSVLAGQDGGDVLGGYAMQVQVDFLRPVRRGKRGRTPLRS
jgi:hypothetical protein